MSRNKEEQRGRKRVPYAGSTSFLLCTPPSLRLRRREAQTLYLVSYEEVRLRGGKASLNRESKNFPYPVGVTPKERHNRSNLLIDMRVVS
jgi:hypothetical protein